MLDCVVRVARVKARKSEALAQKSAARAPKCFRREKTDMRISALQYGFPFKEKPVEHSERIPDTPSVERFRVDRVPGFIGV